MIDNSKRLFRGGVVDRYLPVSQENFQVFFLIHAVTQAFGGKENKLVVFKQLEVKKPLERTPAAVIIHLPSATIEVADGTSQAMVEAVLLALKDLC